jgi:hypothetical protein
MSDETSAQIRLTVEQVLDAASSEVAKRKEYFGRIRQNWKSTSSTSNEEPDSQD